MAYPDIASKIYNQNNKDDPIIRSLLDTDFYKLLMLQMIWRFYKNVQVTFSLTNRDSHIPLVNHIDEKELRAQLDHARSLKFSKKEIIWLKGNSFYGRKHIFKSDFLLWLQNYKLPEYTLEKRDGQYHLSFSGAWSDVTLWEIPALSIINELYARSAIKNLDRFALDVLYARAKTKTWGKIERLQKLPNLHISDFGTRRRHSFLWQRWCVEALKEGVGSNLLGTSNVLLAMETDLEAVGTNAHELPMVLTALQTNEEEMRQAPYKVLQDWERCYNGNLLIVLPDNFGTDSFLKNAPNWVAHWKGFRLDSIDPILGGEKILNWWRQKAQDPNEKLLIFSDGLDVSTIEKIYYHFQDKVNISFGWGTNFTNDFLNCAHKNMPMLHALSLVCKVTQANGRGVVKLSDTPSKIMGTPEDIAYYKRIFNHKLN